MVQKDKQVSGEEAEGIRIPVSAQTCEELSPFALITRKSKLNKLKTVTT